MSDPRITLTYTRDDDGVWLTCQCGWHHNLGHGALAGEAAVIAETHRVWHSLGLIPITTDEELREALLDYARLIQEETLQAVWNGIGPDDIIEAGVSEPPEPLFALFRSAPAGS
jgi:hypothetical protein